MANSANVKLGVCSVSFNGTDLGHTKGGVEVTYTPEYKDITVDMYGNSVVEKVLVGQKWSAKCVLAEYTIANLKIAIPKGTLAGTNQRLTIGSKAGKKISSNSGTGFGTLLLHPTEDSTRTHDICFYKAAVASAITLSHKVDTEKLIEVTFEALVDEDKSDGNYLGLIGDSLA